VEKFGEVVNLINVMVVTRGEGSAYRQACTTVGVICPVADANKLCLFMIYLLDSNIYIHERKNNMQ
jgi:hypothetical protein